MPCTSNKSTDIVLRTQRPVEGLPLLSRAYVACFCDVGSEPHRPPPRLALASVLIASLSLPRKTALMEKQQWRTSRPQLGRCAAALMFRTTSLGLRIPEVSTGYPRSRIARSCRTHRSEIYMREIRVPRSCIGTAHPHSHWSLFMRG